MKYLKFTYVDAKTGISVASEPSLNGTIFPKIEGITFAWARESNYPTLVPEFFGTCPNTSFTQVDGVLGIFVEADFNSMLADEMRARAEKALESSRMSRLEFMGLFSDSELIGIYSAAKSSPAIEVWLDKLKLADSVALGDSRVQSGLNGLVEAGLLTSTRVDQIKKGVPL